MSEKSKKIMKRTASCALALTVLTGTGAVMMTAPQDANPLSITAYAASNEITINGTKWEYERDSNYIKLTKCLSTGAIKLPTQIDNWAGISYSSTLFSGNNGAKITSIEILKNDDADFKMTIPEGMFKDMKSLTKITISNQVKSIDRNAFSGCTALTTVTFASGSSLKTIGDEAFLGCTALKSITLPGSVTTIGSRIFKNTGLTAFTCPANITFLPSQMFDGSPIASVTLESSKLMGIGNSAFYNCSKLTSLDISKTGITEVNDWFGTNSAIENLTLSKTVAKVKSLENCKQLTKLELPDGVKSVEYRALDTGKTIKVVVKGSTTKFDKDAFGDSSSSTIARIYHTNNANVQATAFSNPNVTKLKDMGVYNCGAATTSMTHGNSNIFTINEKGGKKNLTIRFWLVSTSDSSKIQYIKGSANTYASLSSSEITYNDDGTSKIKIDLKNAPVGKWYMKYAIKDAYGLIDGVYINKTNNTNNVLTVKSNLTVSASGAPGQNKDENQTVTTTVTATGNSGTVTYFTEYAKKKSDGTYADYVKMNTADTSTSSSQKIDFSKLGAGEYKIRFGATDSSQTKRTGVYSVKVFKGLNFTTTFTSTTVCKNDTVKIGSITGQNGSGNYNYKVTVTKPGTTTATIIQNYGTNRQNITYTPNTNGQYKISIWVKDTTTGKEKGMSYTVTVINDVINSSYATSPAKTGGRCYKGEKFTLCGRTKGAGSGSTVTYKYEWFDDETNAWTTIRDYSSATDLEWQPTNSGYFVIKVTAKITNGSTVKTREKYMNVRVYDRMYNGAGLVSYEIKAGQNATVKLNASGVENLDKYKFDVYYKNQHTDTSWTTVATNLTSDGTATKAFRINDEGIYNIKIVAKETHTLANGSTVTKKSTKYLNLTVSA